MQELDKAESATRYGAYTAFISAAVTLGITVFALITNQEGGFRIFNDPYILVEVPIIIAFGIGMLRQSRAAAALAFIFHLFNQIIMRIEFSSELDFSVGSGVAIAILTLYGRAFFGAVKYHRLMKTMYPDQITVTKKSKVIGSVASILIALMMVLVVIEELYPEDKHVIFLQDEILDSDYDLFLDYEIIDHDEQLIYFFPLYLNNFMDSGHLITDKRVINYYTGEDSLIHYYYLYREFVSRVELVTVDYLPNINKYRAFGTDEEVWIPLLLSTQLNRHEELLAEIQN